MNASRSNRYHCCKLKRCNTSQETCRSNRYRGFYLRAHNRSTSQPITGADCGRGLDLKRSKQSRMQMAEGDSLGHDLTNETISLMVGSNAVDHMAEAPAFGALCARQVCAAST